MKRTFYLLLCAAALSLWGCHAIEAGNSPSVQNGDILFQSLPHSPLVDAIEGSTHSPYSHCGIAHQTPQGWFVVEAIAPVKETPLTEWISRGRERRYSIYRLQAAYQSKIPEMIVAAQRYLGRPYDMKYELDEEKIYCSELVYKAFRQVTGGTLGNLKTLGELDWKPFEKTIVQIEGGPVPLQRWMITPRALAEAPQLDCVAKDVR